MQKSQASRAVIAARAAANNRTGRRHGVTVLAPSTLSGVRTGPVKRTRCAPMTAAQRNSEGRRSEWTASPYYRTAATVDQRWSA